MTTDERLHCGLHTQTGENERFGSGEMDTICRHQRKPGKQL